MTSSEERENPSSKRPIPSFQKDPDADAGPGGKSFRNRIVLTRRFGSHILRHFLDDGCLLHASALSFTTLLSIVPLLAITFAALKGLGVHNIVEPLLLGRLTGGSQEVADRIITYIDNTKMGSVGAIGLVALFITVISLLGSIEEAFNKIWGARETRSFARKFSDYLSVLLVAPFLLLAATSISTTLQSQSLVSWLIERRFIGDFVVAVFKVVPYLSTWAALIFIYIFIPNTKVRFSSAVVGGLLAGTIWQIAQWAYIHFQIGVSNYNAIYGTLSALPVFMIWIFATWVIVLLGVEIVFAHQNRRTYLSETHLLYLNYAERELISLILLVVASRVYYKNDAPWTSSRFASEVGVPANLVREVLDQLVQQRYLVVTDGEDPGYLPVRDPSQVRVCAMLEDLKNFGEYREIGKSSEVIEVAGKTLSEVKACMATSVGSLSIKDVVERLDNAEAS